MLFRWECVCNFCKAPLDISIMPESENELNWLYTYTLIRPIDLTLNQAVYKFKGYKVVYTCVACYDYLRGLKKYVHVSDRETRGTRPPAQSTLAHTKAEIDQWIQDAAAYSRRPEVVQSRAPIIFLWLYWTVIPGLYQLYQT